MRKTLESRQAWRAERSTGIGASESAAILGVSPWHSPLSLFFEKRGEAPPNNGQEFARRLGLELEDPIARLWSAETKRKCVRPARGTFWLDRHETKPFMLASIDGVCSRDIDGDCTDVLEIKTAAISKAKSWTDEPPIDYIVQVQHQLAVTGAERATIAALIGGVYLRYADIERDQEFIDMLEAACEEFWRRIELNDPPPVDGSDATKEFLKKLYPIAQPESRELPPEAIEWDILRQKYAEEITRLGKLKDEAENRIKFAIGDAAQGVLRNGIVYTHKAQTRVADHVKESTFRVLRRVAPKMERRQAALPGQGAPVSPESIRREYDRAQQLEDQEADLDKPW
jgi:putative phage-type endonuclease